MKRKGTVCFITDDDKVLLVLIEYSPNNAKWTGIGGMVDEGESLEDCLVREFDEESYIKVERKDINKVAEIEYPGFQLNVFLANKWAGDLKAKEAMLKEFRWFPKNNLPFDEMHDGNKNWLPQVLEGKLIRYSNRVIEEVDRYN